MLKAASKLPKPKALPKRVSGRVTGKARYHNGATTREIAAVAMIFNVSFSACVADAWGAAGVAAEAAAVTAAPASEAICVETAACNCTAANSVRAITESYRSDGTVTRLSATMTAVAVAPTVAYCKRTKQFIEIPQV
jgi:hypothetical protein